MVLSVAVGLRIFILMILSAIVTWASIKIDLMLPSSTDITSVIHLDFCYSSSLFNFLIFANNKNTKHKNDRTSGSNPHIIIDNLNKKEESLFWFFFFFIINKQNENNYII